MPLITKRADVLESASKAVRNAVKAFNVGAKNSSGTYIADRLNEQMQFVNTRGDDSKKKKYRFNPTVNARSIRSAAKRVGKGVEERFSKSAERVERMREMLGIAKYGVQTDSLGKNTSPAMQGATVDPPMPQTNYAKNTLENEYANRLNKKQLAEMNRLMRQQDQNGQNQNGQTQTTTTDQYGNTVTATASGMANTGLMAALSVGGLS